MRIFEAGGLTEVGPTTWDIRPRLHGWSRLCFESVLAVVQPICSKGARPVMTLSRAPGHGNGQTAKNPHNR